MVKFNIAIVPQNAHESASERTLKLSQKPHLGAELIPLYELRRDVFPDLDNISLERSIYDKLESLKLRDAHKEQSRVSLLEQHWNDKDSRDIAMELHHLLADQPLEYPESFNVQGLQLPLARSELKQLLNTHRSLSAIARLPMGVSQDNKLYREGLHSSSLLNHAQAQSAIHLINGLSKLAPAHWAMVMATSQFTGLGFNHPSENKALALATLSFTGLGLNHIRLDKGFDAAALDNNVKASSDSRACKALALSSISQTGEFQQVARNRCSGYGTAPIWYQQSMQNGPPSSVIQLAA